MVCGRKQEASDEGTEPLRHPNPPLPAVDGMFRQVTDMAWDAAGNTYISDGYINSRVAKIDRDGNWLKSWGEPGDGPSQFNTPHSIAVDTQGRVYVADRGNRRIQVFDGEGKFLRQITIDVPVDPDARPAIGNKPRATTGAMAPGAPWAICITPGPNQVLFSECSAAKEFRKCWSGYRILTTIGGGFMGPIVVQIVKHGVRGVLSLADFAASGAVGLGVSLTSTYLHSRRKGAESLDRSLLEASQLEFETFYP
jgi:hypothetical protein